jgi:hypothetical protein
VKTKETPPTIGILITHEHKDGHLRLRGYPVQLDAEGHGNVRNICESRWTFDAGPGALCLADLCIDGQGRDDDAERHAYGFEVGYRNMYHVDTRLAVKMAKTLTTIDKRLSKLNDTRGYIRSFGEYVGRVAEVIGASAIVRRPKGQETYSLHSDGYYQRFNLGDGVVMIDGVVRAWIREGREAVA